MHGSPRSPYDNKKLWQFYNYKDFDIVGEPYFDIDFSRLFYLTDTGRRWDGYKVSLRDKIPHHQERWIREGKVYRNTEDIVQAIRNQSLYPQLMLTTHPQRWSNHFFEWANELLSQKIKNTIKYFLNRNSEIKIY